MANQPPGTGSDKYPLRWFWSGPAYAVLRCGWLSPFTIANVVGLADISGFERFAEDHPECCCSAVAVQVHPVEHPMNTEP